jgi:hypothetical protein
MPTIYTTEIGEHRGSDGARSVTTYRVNGLPVGNDCTIGLAGDGKWKIGWHNFKADQTAELIPIPDVLYDSPEAALDAVQAYLAQSPIS